MGLGPPAPGRRRGRVQVQSGQKSFKEARKSIKYISMYVYIFEAVCISKIFSIIHALKDGAPLKRLSFP